MNDNDELNAVLAENIQKAGGAIEDAVTFTLEQAPELAEQALLWHATASLLACLLGIVLLLIGASMIFVFIKAQKITSISGSATVEQKWFTDKLTVIIGGFFLLFGFLYFNLVWLKIWIAPKLWLVEYAASLIE